MRRRELGKWGPPVEFRTEARRRRHRSTIAVRSRILLGGFAAAVIGCLILAPIQAQAGRHAKHPVRHSAPVARGLVSGSIVIDADTGRVLSESGADEVTYPASLTKMMTLYLTFEALHSGRLRLDQYLTVSADAASHAPTKLGLRPGEQIQVQDLILGLVTRSANDAAAVLAEGMAGSEWAFAGRMTNKARQLGMTRTVYRNASGLPDPGQVTTARDMAQLALALYRDYPQEYRYFSVRQFDFRGRVIPNHNHLLQTYDGADGIKTGYIRASGFNLAASAVRGGHRLIGVVLGGPSPGTRDREMAGLLDRGFEEVGVAPTMVARRETPQSQAQRVAAAEPPTAAPSREKPGLLTRASARVASRLAPVAKAEAAVLSHASRNAAAGENWSIQLGAFRAENAAEKVARAAAGIPVAKGKPVQIVQPGKGGKVRLYRARLLNFTPAEAHSACAALHKKKIACSVVPPAGMRVAADR
jgi:D-alanyl-D-alanine carboxypeptidase